MLYPPQKNTETIAMATEELPNGYQPGLFDIVCGRGRVSSNYEGNKKFSKAVKASLPEYTQAPTRIDKSIVVASVVCSLRNQGLRFIKLDKNTKQYVLLNEDQVHEKTGHAIRDLLKSSKPKKAKKSLKKAISSKSSNNGNKVNIYNNVMGNQSFQEQTNSCLPLCVQQMLEPSPIRAPDAVTSNHNQMSLSAMELQNDLRLEQILADTGSSLNSFLFNTCDTMGEEDFKFTPPVTKRNSGLAPLPLSLAEADMNSADICKVFEILEGVDDF